MAEKKKEFPIALVIGAAVALVLGGGIFALARLSGGPKGILELTPEAKAYTKNLKLKSVEMKATEAYLGNAVVEITGKITNAGDKPLQQVDLMSYSTMRRDSCLRANGFQSCARRTAGIAGGRDQGFPVAV